MFRNLNIKRLMKSSSDNITLSLKKREAGLELYEKKDNNILKVSIQDSSGQMIQSKDWRVFLDFSRDAMLGFATELLRQYYSTEEGGFGMEEMMPSEKHHAVQYLGVYLHPQSCQLMISEDKFKSLEELLQNLPDLPEQVDPAVIAEGIERFYQEKKSPSGILAKLDERVQNLIKDKAVLSCATHKLDKKAAECPAWKVSFPYAPKKGSLLLPFDDYVLNVAAYDLCRGTASKLNQIIIDAIQAAQPLQIAVEEGGSKKLTPKKLKIATEILKQNGYLKNGGHAAVTASALENLIYETGKSWPSTELTYEGIRLHIIPDYHEQGLPHDEKGYRRCYVFDPEAIGYGDAIKPVQEKWSEEQGCLVLYTLFNAQATVTDPKGIVEILVQEN